LKEKNNLKFNEIKRLEKKKLKPQTGKEDVVIDRFHSLTLILY